MSTGLQSEIYEIYGLTPVDGIIPIVVDGRTIYHDDRYELTVRGQLASDVAWDFYFANRFALAANDIRLVLAEGVSPAARKRLYADMGAVLTPAYPLAGRTVRLSGEVALTVTGTGENERFYITDPEAFAAVEDDPEVAEVTTGSRLPAFVAGVLSLAIVLIVSGIAPEVVGSGLAVLAVPIATSALRG